MPFIVVDDSEELETAFRLLRMRYNNCADAREAYANARQLAYELPYFLKKKTDSSVHVEDIWAEMKEIEASGGEEQNRRWPARLNRLIWKRKSNACTTVWPKPGAIRRLSATN